MTTPTDPRRSLLDQLHVVADQIEEAETALYCLRDQQRQLRTQLARLTPKPETGDHQ